MAVSAERPAGLETPKLASDKPLFAAWKTPMAPGGVVRMGLDCSRTGGPYDRLIIDSNADGWLVDDVPGQPIVGSSVRGLSGSATC